MALGCGRSQMQKRDVAKRREQQVEGKAIAGAHRGEVRSRSIQAAQSVERTSTKIMCINLVIYLSIRAISAYLGYVAVLKRFTRQLGKQMGLFAVGTYLWVGQAIQVTVAAA